RRQGKAAGRTGLDDRGKRGRATADRGPGENLSNLMPKRVFLVHPTPLAMAPIDEAFKTLWPQAQTINVLDESLYADIPQDGTLVPAIYDRVASLLRHCELSSADGILFSGSTFGPAVDKARIGMRVPVLRAEEAMMEQAVTLGERILLVCTAK